MYDALYVYIFTYASSLPLNYHYILYIIYIYIVYILNITYILNLLVSLGRNPVAILYGYCLLIVGAIISFFRG